MPEAVVKAEVDAALHDAVHGLDHDEEALNKLLEEQGSSREEFDKDAREAAERSVKTQLLLDSIADAGNVTVGQDELTERILFQAQRYGMAPEQFIQQIQQANQLGAVFADVRRGEISRSVVESAVSRTPPAQSSTPLNCSAAARTKPKRMRLIPPRAKTSKRRRTGVFTTIDCTEFPL